MNVSDAILTAIKDGMERFAYSLLWLVQKNLVAMNDDVNSLKMSAVNHEEVTALIASDVLGIKHVQVYSMPIEPGVFLLVLAKQESDARGMYLTYYGKLPNRIDDISGKMEMDFYVHGEGYKTIREMKDSILEFPHLLMVYDRRQRTVEEVEHAYMRKFQKQLRKLEG